LNHGHFHTQIVLYFLLIKKHVVWIVECVRQKAWTQV